MCCFFAWFLLLLHFYHFKSNIVNIFVDLIFHVASPIFIFFIVYQFKNKEFEFMILLTLNLLKKCQLLLGFDY